MHRRIIGILYRRIIKPLAFLRDPEQVHDDMTRLGNILGKYRFTRWLTRISFNYQNAEYLKQEIAGVEFSNPVGLSAGFDKDANLQGILADVGFGFMQIGSVTLNAYGGNPKPRLTRLKKSKGIVVYYGLKNVGVRKIISKLKGYKRSNFVTSISIAKTNSGDTADDNNGIEDYFQSLKLLHENDIGDFYTINISCPNTFGGEPFTTPDKLNRLLKKLTSIKVKKPIYVKMPISITWKEFKGLLDVIVKYKLTGVIIGNLNKDHKDKHIVDEIPENVKGGISGKPCWELSNSLIGKTYRNYGDKLVIVGVGGIFSAEDAYKKIKLGASLVQLITGMIFEGPQLIGEINSGLVKLLKQDGYKNISEAVGAEHRD